MRIALFGLIVLTGLATADELPKEFQGLHARVVKVCPANANVAEDIYSDVEGCGIAGDSPTCIIIKGQIYLVGEDYKPFCIRGPMTIPGSTRPPSFELNR
jgi:hypothetical protein